MAGEDQTIVVPSPGSKERLDIFLRSYCPALSRGTIQRMIEQGDVRVEGQRVKATHRPRSGERIDIHFPPAQPSAAQAEEIPLQVLFEDEDLLVLDKPPGLVVHPAAGHEAHTLVNARLHHSQCELSGIGGVARPGIVHRLDKDTSGCLAVAKNDATHLALSSQFASRQVKKVYHAIVCGAVPTSAGEIRAGIARHPNHRKRMAVTSGGREAWTSYQIVERLNAATLLEAELHTGRTHQIRVHLQHIGFPLVGDETYGKRQNKTLTEHTGYAAPRQMLHASALAFVHPRSEKPMRFEAPLPADFCAAVGALRCPARLS